jgi:hypothetical protein
MSLRECHHPDIRKFDGLRCCLACGEAVFETDIPEAFGGQLSTPTPYAYTPLDYKLGLEIRLLVVQPGEPSDQLRCDIIHVNLEDEPDYEAVSYTWTSDDGDATLSRSIYCGVDKYISITMNCDKALRQLRRRGLRRRLWIDAVCIDQTNITERNHQVGLMDRIYSQSRNVRICIWLDHLSSEGSTGYRDFFRCLQNQSTSMVYNAAWLFSMMKQLFSFRYFTRAWVIQEVVLARAAYLLVNENELLLSRTIVEHLTSIASQNSYRLPGMLKARLGAHSTPFTSIITCLRAGITSECADARDKIFSVLSLMDTHSRSLIPVDYTLDVESVYASAVIALVTRSENLDLLSYATGIFTLDQLRLFLDEKDDQERIDPGLSLGYSTKSHALPPQFTDQTDLYATCPWRANIEVCITEEMDVIPDLSYQHENTAVVFCRKLHDSAKFGNILPHFQVRAHFIDQKLGVFRHPKTQEKVFLDYDTAKWAAYRIGKGVNLFDVGYPHGADLDVILPFFRKARNTAPGSGSMHQWDRHNREDLMDFVETAMEHGENRCLFTTSNSVGFTSCDFEFTDEIWAIDGARIPFILRKIGPKTYRIVGECYLWAALELDYWNPGTRKGRWSENESAHNEQQTHIIEIH